MPKFYPGTTLTSYEPSLRERIAEWAASFAGDRASQDYLRSKAGGVADVIPGVGDVLSADDARRAYERGDYLSAAGNAATTAVGAVPGVGDLAAVGAKALAPTAKAIFLGAGALAKDFPGVTLTSKPNRLLELLHGSRSPIIFDTPKGGIKDVGLHLSNDPEVTGYYSGLRLWDDDLSPLGGRTYPVLADPGEKPFTIDKGMIDPVLWTDPKGVARAVDNVYGKHWAKYNPELAELADDWDQGIPVEQSLKNRGYTSLAYEHGKEFAGRSENIGTAWLFPDSGQVVPKFSPAGVLAAKHNPVESNIIPFEPHMMDEFEELRNVFNDPLSYERLTDPNISYPKGEPKEIQRTKAYLRNIGLLK